MKNENRLTGNADKGRWVDGKIIGLDGKERSFSQRKIHRAFDDAVISPSIGDKDA